MKQASDEQFYCSDRIKDLIDFDDSTHLEPEAQIDGSKIFGDFVSYSRQKKIIKIEVDKKTSRFLMLSLSSEITYSYMGITFSLSTEDLEILKKEEKFLISLSVIKTFEENSYE